MCVCVCVCVCVCAGEHAYMCMCMLEEVLFHDTINPHVVGPPLPIPPPHLLRCKGCFYRHLVSQ